MAQISKGIKLGYAVAVDPRTEAPTYTYFSDITGIPSLSATPTTHDVTTLDDAAHVYIKGLVDIGGTLDFPCNFTPELIAEVEACISAGQSDDLEFCVEFPAPLSKRYYFNGEASMVVNDSVDVDAPVTGTLSIIPNTTIEAEDIV